MGFHIEDFGFLMLLDSAKIICAMPAKIARITKIGIKLRENLPAVTESEFANTSGVTRVQLPIQASPEKYVAIANLQEDSKEINEGFCCIYTIDLKVY